MIQLVLERVDDEIAEIGRHLRRRHALHQRFGAHPVLDQIGDGDHQDAVALREARELRHPRHGAVLVHHLADHAARIESRDPRQIDRRLGLAGAHHHAAVARAQRRHVAGPHEIRRLRRRVDGRQNRRRAIGCRDAGGDVVLRVDRHAERRAERRRVRVDGERNVQLVEPLAGEREADLSAAVARHEVDHRRRHFLRRDRQIAFVLPIGIVDDNHHAAGANLLDRVFDSRERRLRPRDFEDGPSLRPLRPRLARSLARRPAAWLHFVLHVSVSLPPVLRRSASGPRAPPRERRTCRPCRIRG